MIYAFLASFLVGLVVGGFGVHWFDAAEIVRLQSAIVVGNSEADARLSAETARVTAAEAKALDFNHQLESANASAVASVNAVHDHYAGFRLFDSGRKAGGCGSSAKGAGASVFAGAGTGTELSAELAEFLESEAARADRAAVFADGCRRFVVDSQCGFSASTE